jgi:hypothetical protein
MLKLERQVKGEARESPVKFLDTLTIRIATEAGRIDPRRAEKVIEVCSPTILKMVRTLVSPTSTSSVPPPYPRGSWCGHRPVYLEFLIVTLGRQSSCRVGL